MMHPFIFGLLFIIGVDASIPHSHYTHVSRRFHGHPQTLVVFPRSSRALNTAESPIHSNPRHSEQNQARQLKREVTDHDWERSTGAKTVLKGPGRGVDYLSNTGPAPAVQPPPATESSVGTTPTPSSLLVDPPSATVSKKAKKQQHRHKGALKHAGRSKKMGKKALKV